MTQALQQEEELSQEILARRGGENVFFLHEEIARVMVHNVTVKRDNKTLAKTVEKLKEFRERMKKVAVHDSSRFANKTFHFVRQMEPMLELALAITKGALLRNEFRGSHYKPEFPKRDDINWLKTTLATYSKDEPEICYKPVDIRHVNPELRDYTQKGSQDVVLANIPANISFPI